jgi:hypothetical protein
MKHSTPKWAEIGRLNGHRGSNFLDRDFGGARGDASKPLGLRAVALFTDLESLTRNLFCTARSR